MKEKEIKELIFMCIDRNSPEEITPESSCVESGINSLDWANILYDIETCFHVNIPDKIFKEERLLQSSQPVQRMVDVIYEQVSVSPEAEKRIAEARRIIKKIPMMYR